MEVKNCKVHGVDDMSYEAWRISFQDSEQAAKAAYEMAQRYRVALAWNIYSNVTLFDDEEATSWDEVPDRFKKMYLKNADESASLKRG